MNKLERLAIESKDSVVAVLSDLAVRKLTSHIWYSKSDKKQSLRALAAAVSFIDSAVLCSIALDNNNDIRQEYIRIKNYVVNSSPETKNISNEIDSLSHIAFYMKNEEKKTSTNAESLVEYW